MPSAHRRFCPYLSGPEPCPTNGRDLVSGRYWRCRALQEDGTCIRLEADKALAWILQHCIADCGSRVRVLTRTDEREAL